MNPKVDEYLSKVKKWQAEMVALRTILLDCDLIEEVKWKQPCYMFEKSDIVLLSERKDCCAVSFLKGALLKDPHGIMIKPGENSRSGRWVKFTDVDQIAEMEPILRAYIQEAIEAEKAGLKVDFKKNTELEFPEELLAKLDEDPAFKAAFEALTPGRQRGYNLFFSAPKQSKTRVSRIEKSTEKILAGKGMHDCTCGLSKRMPTCDGSHKAIQ